MVVTVPPKITAYDKGSMNSAVEKPYFEQNSCKTGIKNATTGVLFRNAEIVPETMHKRSSKNWTEVLGPVPYSNIQRRISSAPADSRPCAKAISDITVSIPSLLNPIKALEVGRKVEHIKIVKAPNMTHSGWKCSVASTQNIKKTTRTV
jgi:hypothetical protein